MVNTHLDLFVKNELDGHCVHLAEFGGNVKDTV